MPGPSWLQINLAAPAINESIFEEIFKLVESLEKEKLISCFYFVRKAPGLRLRFALAAASGDAVQEIETCFDHLVRLELVTKWFPSVYEPETFKFGGPEAIAVVHQYFFSDSTLWWRWEQLQQQANTSIGTKLLSVSVLNDLFERFLDGPEEIWDVWCRVAAVHGVAAVNEGPEANLIRIDDLIDKVTPPEQIILRNYSSSNDELARQFGDIHANGKLLYANRLVLPHIALYHWNRYGFTLPDRASMFTAMIHLWSSTVWPRPAVKTNTHIDANL